MAHSLASDSMTPGGKLPPTLTPTGHFAGKPTLPISRSVTLIGSRKQARLQLISSTVSQNHALIVNADSGPYVRDLASREHVIVNGIQVKEGSLEDGDEIQVGRFSFRFNASPHTQPIEAIRNIKPAPVGKVEVEGSDLPVPIDGKSVLIGRRDGCDIKLLEDSVSTTHAILFEMDGRRYIRDLASRTGTFVNGKQIHQIEIMPGDSVKCGTTEMRYVTTGEAAEEASSFASLAPAADLGANVDDLVELDTQESAAPVQSAPPQRPAAPAGAEALELVQDQPAELEPADINAPGLDLEPLDLETEPEAIEVEAEPVEVETEAVEVEAVEEEPVASAEAPMEIAPVEPEPIRHATDLDDFDITDEPVEAVSEDDLLVELDALSASPTPQAPPPAPTSPVAKAPTPAAQPPAPKFPVPPPPARMPPRPVRTPPPAAVERPPLPIDEEIELEAQPSAEEIDLGLELEAEPVAPAKPATRVTPPSMPISAPEPEPIDEIEVEEVAVEPVEVEAEAPVPAEEEVELEAVAEAETEAIEVEPEPVEVAAEEAETEPEPEPIEVAAEDAEPEVETEPEPVEVAASAAAAPPVEAAEGEFEDEADEEEVAEVEAEAEEPAPVAAAPAPVTPAPVTKEADDELAAIDFDLPDVAAIESELPMADVAAETTPDFDLDAELPDFTKIEEEPIDFAVGDAAEAASLNENAFAPIDESSIEIAPLDLGGGVEPMPAFDDDAALAALDFPGAGGSASSAAAAAASAAPLVVDELAPKLDLEQAIAPPPKTKKKGGRKKKGEPAPVAPEPIVEAPPVAPVPSPLKLEVPPVEAPPVARRPSRVAPPGASQLDLTPIADSELLAPTEATPESALPLDEAVAGPSSDLDSGLREVELTDSTFGRTLDEFAGRESGDIVEAPAAPQAEPQAEAEVTPVEVEAEPELQAAAAEPETLDTLDTIEPTPVDEVGAVEVEELAPIPKPPHVEAEAPAAAPADEEEIELEPVAEAETPKAVDDEATLELLAEDASRQPADSLGLTLDEDRVLAAPEPLLSTDKSPAASELAPPETTSADDRLFDLELELEPLPTDAEARAADPRYSVHPEDLDESATAGAIEAKPVDADELDIVESDTAEAIEEEPAVSAGQTEDTLGEYDDLAIEEEPAPAAPTASHEDNGRHSREPAVATPPPMPVAEAPVDFDLEPPDLSALGGGEDVAEVELEPVGEAEFEIEAEPEPVAELPMSAAPVVPPPAVPTPPPVATPAPRVETPESRPPQPPPDTKRPAPIEAFNWGANQEHFFGGMPLQLDPNRGAGAAAARAPQAAAPPQQPPPRAPIQPPPTAPVQPAARAPQQPPQPPPQRQAPPAMPSAPAASFPTAQPRRGAGQQSPFAGGGRVSTGFDGLAAGDADVFGQAPGSLTAGFDPALMNDVFGGTGRGSANNIPPTGTAPPQGASGRRQMPTPQPNAAGSGAANPNANNANASARRQPPAAPRLATKSEPPGDAWSGSLAPDLDAGAPPLPRPQRRGGGSQPSVPAVHEGEELASAQPPAKKKRRWFGLRVLVPFAILTGAAAFAAVYYFMPVKSSVTGVMQFQNFAGLPQRDRQDLASKQRALLMDSGKQLRGAAVKKLTALNKSTSPGFLASDDALEYAKVVTAQQFDLEKGTLSLPYRGGSGKAEQDRMFAMLQALYDQNTTLISNANDLNRTVESLKREQAEMTKQVEEKRLEIEQLSALAEKKPDVAERAKLEAEAARLESAWNTAVANVTRISAEVKQLKENPAAALQAVQTPASTDAVVQQLQGEMTQLNEKLAVVQEGRGDQAKAAREKLDAAVESFNQQLTAAQGAVKNNPELLAYLTQAQQTLKKTRDLTDQLIGRQQEQYGQLSKVKQQLNEKMLARRDEVWKKDPELVNLMDQRDLKTRQYNAAVGQGLSKEAADLKVELNTLETGIAARQTLVADDSFYADAIDQLQKLADSQQRNLEQDRGAVMSQLDEMQQEIARSQPPIEKLTPDQQKLAKEMGQRLADVSEARKQYAAAADAANKSADEEMRTLQASASDLASKVQARKAVIAQAGADQIAPAPAADPKVALDQKERELAAAEATRAAAESSYFAANKKLLDVKRQFDEARAAGEKRDAEMRKRDALVQQARVLDDSYALKKKLAEQTAYPAVPTPETSVKVFQDQNEKNRPMYALGACGVVAALCVGLGFLGSATSRSSADGAGDDSAYGGADDGLDQYAFDDQQVAQPRQRPTPVEV